MSIFLPRILVTIGIAAAAAMESGDVDEAARQDVLAGSAVIARDLAAHDRATVLAAIAAAPTAAGGEELLVELATAAAGPDRRVAIPAAAAARTIARDLAARVDAGRAPDDYAPADLDAWRTDWAALALRGDRWIELRVLALDTTAALASAIRSYPTSEVLDLGPAADLGVDRAAALGDPDPAFVRTAQDLLPR